ncbi:lambda-crystallin-like [Convolutriloba macropyga]|uniref:lambda-crystallin-like n=1 Tax=Convolutriloba macropyga TaxID=536237 RepID=UPI003F5235CC
MASSDIISYVSIVGSGAIGQSLGIIFASHGVVVKFFDALFEADKSNIEKVKTALSRRIEEAEFSSDESAAKISRITLSESLAECVKDTELVYECVFENVAVKQEVLGQIDDLVGDSTIMASSTSCIMPSILSGKLKHKENFVISHPVNPPFYWQLIEVVPAPWTNPLVVEKVKNLMDKVGQKPICLKKEVDGFALNRVQYTVINSSWKLVRDGILSPEDVDKLMLYGLGPRYAVIGPFQTMQTNAPNGIVDYMSRYQEGMSRVTKACGTQIDYDNETLEAIQAYLDENMPVAEMAEMLKKRDVALKKIKKLKTD